MRLNSWRTLLLLSWSSLGTLAGTPPVKVSLRSSWPAPPLFVEILETITLENPDAFFPLLDALSDPDVLASPNKMTAEAIYQSSLQVAVTKGMLSEPGSLASVEMNLALHAATPKIEAFYHHYTNVDKMMNLTGKAFDSGCASWVDWYGQVVCDVETLAQLAGIETIDSSDPTDIRFNFTRPKTLTFDHIYPPLSQAIERPSRTAILYASFTSPNFRELHSYLLSLAEKPVPHVEYIIRHVPPTPRDIFTRNYLSGYGVALDLKKTDYLAVDDRGAGTHQDGQGQNADASSEGIVQTDPILDLIDAYPEDVTVKDATTPLNEEELAKIGYQATQLVADSSDPLSILTHLSQNFPKYASSLARRVTVNESVELEIHSNQMKAQGGVNMMWLNGESVAEKDMNPFGFLRLLRKERSIMRSLTSLNLTNAQSIELLTHPIVGAAQSAQGVVDGMFDASDRPEGGEVIMYWNNLEKDKRYAGWSPSLSMLLRPTFPGTFHSIRLNVYNVILVLDLSQMDSINFLSGPVSNIISRDFPFRFGVVPIVETEDGLRMARLFQHLVQRFGRKETMLFLKRISQLQLPPHLQTSSVDWDLVRSEFEGLLAAEEEADENAPKTFDAVFEDEALSETWLDKTKVYVARLGASLTDSPGGHAFVNGKHFKMDDMFLRNLQMEIGQQAAYLQEKLYGGELSNDNATTISTYFYDLPTSGKRRNRHIFPTAGNLRIFKLPEVFERTGFPVNTGSYLYPADSPVIPLTLYVIADLDTDAGLTLVKEALSSITSNSLMRISFIHNPTNGSVETTRSPTSWLFSHLISTKLLSKASPSRLLRALGFDLPEIPAGGTQTPLSPGSPFEEMTGGLSLRGLSADNYSKYVEGGRRVVQRLKLSPGQQALVINGRVVGPFIGDDFVAADFQTLEDYEYHKRAEAIVKALNAVIPSASNYDRASFAHLVSMSSSIVASIQLPDPSESGLFDAPQRPRQRNYRMLDGNLTTFTFGDNSTAMYQLAVLVDPLSEIAQKWSSLLRWISNVPDIFIEVHLNPTQNREMPLKRFYRFNLIPSLSFDEDGNEVSSQVIFEDLSIEPIYTLAMDVPPSWLVRPQEALYDLDNIQLGKLFPEDSSVDAVFQLDYLVIEGHARNTNTNSPPRGVQLELTNGESVIDDTLVVANLGYLQFKAKPGVFQLQIRKGRGRDIFEMESVGNEGWDSPSVGEVGNEITLTSFEGLTLYPRLVRRQGMETEDVLADPEEEEERSLFDNIASKFMSMFKVKETPTAVERASDQADINIFTVASGLLYERFASIMILSVLRNTKRTVKFWFIENFLSPSFLEFIPHFAEEYGFQYELVTYKWPSWLRAQKEKQRIIWAYKILFLDVLFPMDLKKVIFVDADQIVRADLQELVDLDLHGAPYGYTPMGDDNEDMEGFRFWKTGYWKDFLQGKPYHISALYVVDLVRFRQIAAGDILRGQYHQLSADPNSLANLDQDLPNNLQREVPIFSLHEDWLWCETWCSKDRLHRAKTIDLCQNPLTKEPKLSRARQIPEWEKYDAEIARFAQKLTKEGVLHSRIAAADTRVLANAGTASSGVDKDVGDEVSDAGEATEAKVKDESDEVRAKSRDEL